MKKEIQEQDVIRLLEDWKKRDTSYPTELQDQRRQAFLALGASALTLEAGSAVAGESLTLAGHATAHLPMTLGMKLTLGILSTVIVGLSAYLGVTLYENRDAIRELFRESTPTVVLVAESPSPPTPLYITPTFMAFGTPTPTGSMTPTPLAPSTEETYAEATATKPGLHLGWTKTPRPKP